jgi:hypothetical protein
LECNRHTKILSCIQRNSVQRGRRESFMARGNAKVPGIHIRKQKIASAVCSDNTIGVRVRAMKRNLSARHRCTTCVLRRSTNAPECRLRLECRRKSKHNPANSHRDCESCSYQQRSNVCTLVLKKVTCKAATYNMFLHHGFHLSAYITRLARPAAVLSVAAQSMLTFHLRV